MSFQQIVSKAVIPDPHLLIAYAEVTTALEKARREQNFCPVNFNVTNIMLRHLLSHEESEIVKGFIAKQNLLFAPGTK